MKLEWARFADLCDSLHHYLILSWKKSCLNKNSSPLTVVMVKQLVDFQRFSSSALQLCLLLLITKLSLLSEKLVCSLKGQSIWVPKFYSCCYTKTRNGSHVASVPTHWTELNLHAQQSVSDYDKWIGSIPFWSALLAVWKFRFCFARACPRKKSTQEYDIRQRGAFTATSSPQLMNLIGGTRKNTRAARAART